MKIGQKVTYKLNNTTNVNSVFIIKNITDESVTLELENRVPSDFINTVHYEMWEPDCVFDITKVNHTSRGVYISYLVPESHDGRGVVCVDINDVVILQE